MKEIKSEDIWNEEKSKKIGDFIKALVEKQTPEEKEHIRQLGEKHKKEDMTKFDDKEDELFDPWEHLYEEESEFQKIKTPKVKKVKKEREYPIRRKRKR